MPLSAFKAARVDIVMVGSLLVREDTFGMARRVVVGRQLVGRSSLNMLFIASIAALVDIVIVGSLVAWGWVAR
jgi:hypothetical protein